MFTWAAVMLNRWASWVAVDTFILEFNEAICSCQIIAAQHPGPLLPIYISQRAEPNTQIEPSEGIWEQKIRQLSYRRSKKPPPAALGWRNQYPHMRTNACTFTNTCKAQQTQRTHPQLRSKKNWDTLKHKKRYILRGSQMIPTHEILQRKAFASTWCSWTWTRTSTVCIHFL